jgi:glycerol-3-phosphate dehydrogenase
MPPVPGARLEASPPPPLSAATRAERLQHVGDEPFDVVVVGGGITGAGIARDAAMRGLRTLLVERDDLASGTSSASSKLVHGGLRYLNQRRFGLVAESVHERRRLRLLAPHLVRPLPFVFPVYERRPKPLWVVGTGLWIYEALALFRGYRLHQTLGAAATLEQEPVLAADGLDGAVKYWDCATDDARLTLETARAAHDAGAWVLTWTQVVGFASQRGQVRGVELHDRVGGGSATVEAKVVVNATGPWTDRTLGLRGDRPRLLQPTKGVHVVVPAERLPVNSTVVLTRADIERTVFAMPWGNRVVLGTTDTDYSGDYDHVVATADDVDDLLGLAAICFPDAHLGPEDVCATWAGLRPLISGGEGPNATKSREHLIVEHDDGLITVAGGKLTTYRKMAAEVMDRVAGVLRREGMHVGGCPTAAVPLPGGNGIAWRGDHLATLGPDGAQAEADLVERFGADVADHLKTAYGGRWTAVARRAAEDTALAERIAPDHPYLWAEVAHAAEEELVVTLRDFLRRRTPLEIRDVQDALDAAPAVAGQLAGPLGWNLADQHDQLADFRAWAAESTAWQDV